VEAWSFKSMCYVSTNLWVDANMEFKKKIETQYQEFKSNPIEGGMK
jgi:hypothetical protein